MPKRIDECAKSSSVPIALKTYDGSNDADVQALRKKNEPLSRFKRSNRCTAYLPDDKATSFKAINKLSPSTQEKEILIHPKMKMDEKKMKKISTKNDSGTVIVPG